VTFCAVPAAVGDGRRHASEQSWGVMTLVPASGTGQRFVAVIGGGVSGLTAAYLLARAGHHVTLYEADDRLGGHARTHQVTGPDGRPHRVDTGFVAYSERTYPLFTRLLAELEVTGRDTELSMSVRCEGCGLQYAGQRGPRGLLTGLTRGRSRYTRVLAERPRFHLRAGELLDAGGHDDNLTLGQFLAEEDFSAYFRNHFVLPLVAAVWSCPPATALHFPARYLFEFLRNHGLLSVHGAPAWKTVTGGSQRYVGAIAQRLAAVQTSAPARAVHRFPDGAAIRDGDGRTTAFDHVVMATHPGQALGLLAHPTPAEEKVLGAFPYLANPALLHTDTRLLPRRSGLRASRNYQLSDCDGPQQRTRVSYHLNRLQQLDAAEDYIVTLGGEGAVASASVLDRIDFEHPVYTPESVAAQRHLPELNTGSVVYAGAYHGWGFHEDGCRSGVNAARALGVNW
jgi:predicted NAD/FAD-binding protein